MRRLWSSVLFFAASAPAFAADGSIQVAVSNVPSELVLDGFPTGKQPPATLTGVAPGLHRVEIAHGCVAGAVDVDVKEGATVKANLVVKNIGGEGTIRLQGVPDSATIFMDDAPVDSFDKGIKTRCGGHKLMIEAPGYETQTEMVTVTTNTWTTVKIAMKGGSLEGGGPVATRPPASRPAEPSFDDEEEEETPRPVATRPPPVAREPEPDIDPDAGDDEEEDGFSDEEEAAPAKPTRSPPREEIEESKPSKPSKPPPKAREEEEEEEEEEEYERAKPAREPRERKECEVWFCIGGSQGGAIALVSVFGAAGAGGLVYGGVQAGTWQDAVASWNNASATQGGELTEAQIAAYQNNITVSKKKMIIGMTLGSLGVAVAGGTVGIMAVANGDASAMTMTWEF